MDQSVQFEPGVVQGPIHHVVPGAELPAAVQPAGRVLRELTVMILDGH